MTDAIQVQNVYKQYNKFGTFRVRTLVQDLKKVAQQTSDMVQSGGNTRYVLNDISFNLERGKSLGLIGHNGSGKTTLLRLLAGVSLPTKGRIRVVGKVAPLLALGAGFHPDLTGHENLFLNCTLMGLSRKQSADRIDQIIDFADIGEYIEVPIKRYSSGMLARLGFAAAIHMDPEIILLDEVLSVGDYVFGIKARSAILKFIGEGTLVFVSHDLDSVEKLCERVIWMDNGHIRAIGNASEVIADYMQDQQKHLQLARAKKAAEPVAKAETKSKPVPVAAPVPEPEPENDPDPVKKDKRLRDPRVQIKMVSIHGDDGAEKSQFEIGETIVIRCHLHLTEPIPNLRVVLGITDINSKAVITACDNQQLEELSSKAGDLVLEGVFPSTHIRPRGLGAFVTTSNPIELMELASWKDLGPRFFTIGARRDAEHHYYAPQADLVYTPNVKMRIVSEDIPESS